LGFDNPTTVTAYAALCVCEAIETLCGLCPAIKWVNDIFWENKKICGILTEAITEFENSHVREIILGIGVNISTKPGDFPKTLRDIAGSLYPNGNPPITRNHLAAEIKNRVLQSGKPREVRVFERYKARLFMLGTDITVMQGNESYTATALDIDEKGRLIVRNQSGETKALSSGEIKIS
jgi:BirA family biotin operon repressor/biotin-[acetyl-CoA-carboxylase] ligase